MTVAVPTIAVFPEEKLTLDQKIEKWVWHYSTFAFMFTYRKYDLIFLPWTHL